MESQAYANPLPYRLASIAADQNNSAPRDHIKVPPSTRADKTSEKDIDADTQLICDITQECAALFKQLLGQTENQLTDSIYKCKGEFCSWTACLDELASESAILGIPWKLESDIRDPAMLLLDVLQKDLRLVIKLEPRSLNSQHNPLSHGSSNTNPNDDSRLLLSDAVSSAMKNIEESVDKLRNLTIIIWSAYREHSSLEQKVVDFAKRLPRNGFQDETRRNLKKRFPKAEERLITKLVGGIAFRCHHILYERHHHVGMRYVRRPSATEGKPAKQQSPQNHSPHDHQDVLDSELGSSTNWMFFRTNRVDGQDDGCTQKDPIFFVVESLWLDKSGHPIPPDCRFLSSAMCQICFQELQVGDNKDPTWWDKHVESDMEHYVCLSEDCEKSLCYFKSFDSWLEHMNEKHPHDWPRFTYSKKSEWRCEVSENCSTSFDNEDSLRKHLADNHPSDLEDLGLSGLQRLVEKSKFPKPRDSDICPLCEESIDDLEPVIQQSEAENDGSRKKDRRLSDGEQSILGAVQNDDNEGTRSATNTNSSIRPDGMDLRMAAHIADHLKSASLLCLEGLEPKQ